jgi:hypothetical protein
MATDFSRVRLNPLLDYAGVELKQGGVLLDADANELVDIVDRRLRALASDVLGRATVSATTTDAFKIAVAGSKLTIGKGRLYVDGLLAENHGAKSNANAKRVFDDLLAEPQFADPIDYAAQPYLPAAPPLPTAGRHLVYLDVWDREVTHLEDPDLVESAVGVEATSRIQTVWQVRAAADDAGAQTTCASPNGDLPGWEGIIAASTGVLTTDTFEVAPVDDPCELPPTGGYRGLENQLYRVEIHEGGQPGSGATFKWSRENSSVASRVASVIAGGELELVSLGRDDVLSFKTGDWVEILDDAREFSQAPGEIRQVTVDAATRRIQFTPALPPAMLPAAFPNSAIPDKTNLRVRRWDQSGKIYRTDLSGTPVQVQDLGAAASTGLIAVPAATTTLLLENGITVRFDSTGARGFKPGDYWVFAARTADATVEQLDRAPPRGVHHHFARLGIWDVAAGIVTDCRHPWPPAGDGHDCSCTACVTAESHLNLSLTIQDAVNKVSQTGGTVCIGPGQYALREPVLLTGVRSVRIRGQGPSTVIAAGKGAFILRNCVAVAIEGLAILSLGLQPAIGVETAIGLGLHELLIAVLSTNDGRASAISLGGVVAAASISENAIFASTGILANDPLLSKEGDPPSFLLAAALAIQDNVFWCGRQAVTLDGNVMHFLNTKITGNDVLACSEVSVSALGMGLTDSSMTISDNSFYVTGSGIRCATDGVWISDNKLVNTKSSADSSIAIELTTGFDKTGTDQCQVLANQISGFGSTGIAINAPVRDLIIKLNIIESCGNGIVAVNAAADGSLSIENNHLRNIDSTAEGSKERVAGILVERVGSATIAGNTIRALGVQSVQAALRAGILAFGVERVRISGNQITELGPAGDFTGQTAGIMLRAPLTDFEVAHNRVERDLEPSTQSSNGAWAALVVLDTDPKNPLSRIDKLTTVRLDLEKTLVLGAGRPLVVAFPPARAAVAEQLAGAKGSILGNVFNARGETPAVDVTVAECLFNDNRVEAPLNHKIAVVLAVPIVIVNANRVIGGELAIQITGATAKSAAVLGNITRGGIAISGTGLSPPWDALNLHA